jgi:hypothetical protein
MRASLALVQTLLWLAMLLAPAFAAERGMWMCDGKYGLCRYVQAAQMDARGLYEQCSFHIAEKMPSSVKVGTLPISSKMRSLFVRLEAVGSYEFGGDFG